MIPHSWAAVLLWVQILSSWAPVVRGDTPQQDACKGVLQNASAVPKESRSYEVYRQCHLQRPSGGFVSDGSAKEDCAQFGRLYRMAAHYGEPKPDEFCSMVAKMRDEEVTVDPRVAEHRVCMSSLPKILQYPNVTETTKAACLALKPKLPEIEVACGRYAMELGNAVSLGLLDEHRLCDRVLTGGFTSGFDQDHFVYSCEQYAANLAKRKADGEGPRELGIEAKKNCDSHVPPIDKPFCMEYTRMALQSEGDINRTKFAEICEMQYHRMQDPNYGKPQRTINQTNVAPANASDTAANNETGEPTIIAEPEPIGPTDAAPPEKPVKTGEATGAQPVEVGSREAHAEPSTSGSKERPHGAYVGAGAENKQVRILLHHHKRHHKVKQVSQQALDSLVKAKAVTTRRKSKHQPVTAPPTKPQQRQHRAAKKAGYMKYLSAWTHPGEPEHKVQSLVSETSTVINSAASDTQEQDASSADSDEGVEAGILKGFLAQDGSLAGASAEKAVTRAAISDGDDPSEAVEEADESSKAAMGSSGDVASAAPADDDGSTPKVQPSSGESSDGSSLSAVEVSAETSESSDASPSTSPAPSEAKSDDDSTGVDDMVESFLTNNS